jgi:Na+-translocating ferredoxin:NAD+ oxidoreductase RnfG subunit
MTNSQKSIVVLTAICLVLAVLLAGVNAITAPIIAEADSAAANKALSEVYPGAKDFVLIDLSQYENVPESVNEAYKVNDKGGYVVKLTVSGYKSGLVIMCGIDGGGAVTGVKCLSSNETLGAEKTYGEKLVSKTLSDIDTVDTEANATLTTSAYRNAVKEALGAAAIFGGGSFDNRSEEEIALDTALPSAEGKFTSWFMTEKLDGVSAVYIAENGTGYVLVFGDEYIGASVDGTVVSEGATAANAALVPEYITAIKSSALTEIDLTQYTGIATHVKAAYITASGNYVFDLEAKGFGINGDSYYNPSGKPIKIKVSVTADGKIISCVTVEQYESQGIGSLCAEPDYYTRFNGLDKAGFDAAKNDGNFKIDVQTGATYTTNGYITAVSKVFEALNIIKGGV